MVGGDSEVIDVDSVSKSFGSYMGYMFSYASSFNQSIGNWDVSQVTDMNAMFDQITLSVANYDNLLTGWSVLKLQSGVPFDARYSKYSSTVGEPARTYIIDTF